MAVALRMPKLGLTMEEGTITSWLIDNGDVVEAGTAVLEIVTDKAETEVESPDEGRLHRLGAVGTTYPCGAVIGWLLADDEAPPVAAEVATAAPAPSATPAPTTNGRPAPAVVAGGRLLASPNARRVAAAAGVDLRAVPGTGPGGRIVSEDVEELVARGGARQAGPVRSAGPLATFAARTLADLLGVDLAAVAPSPDGRINRDDVAAHVRRLLAAATTSTAPVAPPSQEPTEVVPLTGMRGTIAKRMHAALRDMAQLTLTMDADMTAVVADRTARAKANDQRPPSFTDYVVAATARALKRHPLVNSQVTDEGIALLPRVHVGVAVASDKGLYVPVVRDTDQLGVDALAIETRRLAEAGRAGKLRLDDLEGATFSVSTLGMYGVDAFTPVINPPNVAILGVGRLREDSRLTLSLTWDHRVLDGAPAAEFCRTIVELLAAPAELA